MTTKNRLLPDLPFPEYLADIGYGSSDLRNFAKLPALVPWHRANRGKGTDATIIGSAAHCLILTPSLFQDTYLVKPAGMKFSTKEGKAWRDDRVAAGYSVDNMFSAADYEQVQNIKRAFVSREVANKSLLAAEHREATLLWTSPEGLPCKGRPDWFTPSAVYDLKVTVHAQKGLAALRYKAWSEGWFHQLAHNRSGLRACGYPNVNVGRLVCIAPAGPSSIQTYTLEVSEHNLDVIELEMESIRAAMVKCHNSGEWPGVPDAWEKIDPPDDAILADPDEEDESDPMEGDDDSEGDQ
jgi:hypothetical protein